MHVRTKRIFPKGSLLSAMFTRQAGMDLRRTARRLHSEGAPVLAIDAEVSDLARKLSASEVSRSPAVMECLPPLFWIEVEHAPTPSTLEIRGWLIEKKRSALAVRCFRVVAAKDAIPEMGEALVVEFDPDTQPDDEETHLVRGQITAASLPGLMAQMGEHSPVAILPAEASVDDASALRGFRLSVVTCPSFSQG